jgi:Fe(3+) dicitrate transport protein
MGKTQTTILLPGMGVTYDITTRFLWFAGMHRGFSPARYESAISPEAEDIALRPETSWNYESGVRGNLTRYFYTQFTTYYLDFDDKIINSSAAGGNLGARPVHAGRSTHRGVEIDAGLISENGKNGLGSFLLKEFIPEMMPDPTSILTIYKPG